jgi:hypothetical protein
MSFSFQPNNKQGFMRRGACGAAAIIGIYAVELSRSNFEIAAYQFIWNLIKQELLLPIPR